MTIRIDSQQKAKFDSLCEQFGMSANTAINIFVRQVAKTEHVHPLRAVQSTHFWAENRLEIGLKNGAYPFNIA